MPLTADPFNARVEAFLEKIKVGTPAKIPALSQADREKFLEYVDFRFGYDADLTTGVIIKRKPI